MKNYYVVKPIRHMEGGWISSEVMKKEDTLKIILSKKPSDYQSDYIKKNFLLRIFTKEKELKSLLRISQSKNPNKAIYIENPETNSWEKIEDEKLIRRK